MAKPKKFIKSIFNKFGFDVVKWNGYQGNINVLSKNFDNLVLNYQNLFGDKFGELPANENRLNLVKSLLGTPPSEAYFIINSLHKTKDIEGDICEFGVAQGSTSQLIANEVKSGNKKLHLFDSFEGLPAPTEKDLLKDDIFNLGSMKAYTGTMSNPENLVRNRLAQLEFPENRYVTHKGFIEELIKSESDSFPTSVSFAYVDFDFYEPIQIALDYLHTVTKKGAILMVDDYDFFSTGAKTAADEFVQKHEGQYDIFVPDTIYGHFALLTKKAD